MTFEVGSILFPKSPLATQVFFGGLDPSVDRDVLEKLFGSVPNMVSILMDTDSENHFKVATTINTNGVNSREPEQ